MIFIEEIVRKLFLFFDVKHTAMEQLPVQNKQIN